MTRMIGPGTGRGTRQIYDKVRDTRNVLGRDHIGYDGRIMAQAKAEDLRAPGSQGQKKLREDWRLITGRQQDRERAARAAQDSSDAFDRSTGRQLLGITFGGAAIGAGTAEAGTALNRRSTRKMRAELQRGKSRLAKAANRDAPFLQDATAQEGGAHRTTLLGEKEAREARLNPKPGGGRMAAFGRGVLKRPGLTATGIVATSGGLALPSLIRAEKAGEENEKVRRQLRAQRGKIAAQTRARRAAGEATLAKRSSRDQDTRGSAMTAAGSVIGGTGLVAGGIPGTKEPNALQVHGARKKNSELKEAGASRKKMNAFRRQTVRQMLPQPKAGILGWRGNAHQAYIGFNQDRHDGNAYTQGMRAGKLESERKIVRGMRIGRKASYVATAGGGALTVAGVRRTKQEQVRKLDDRGKRGATAAVAGGATLAGVGQVVPSYLGRHSRRYESSAKKHVLAAQKYAPHFGGLQTRPAKVDEITGAVKRPASSTMYPARSDKELREKNAIGRKVKGGDEAYRSAGYHRGIAAQERHFVEVFNSTGKAIRRVRNPGLALAAVGGTSLATRRANQPSGVRKAATYGVQEKTLSPLKAAEGAVGIAGLAWGASRLGMTGKLIGRGAKALGVSPAKGYALNTAVRHQTGRGEAVLRGRVKGFGTSLDVIPRSMRAGAVTGVGAALTIHSMPWTKTTFHPTNRF